MVAKIWGQKLAEYLDFAKICDKEKVRLIPYNAFLQGQHFS